MEIIGLSGYARTGKDEVAKILTEEYGFTRVAFADKLREVLLAINPIVAANPEYHAPLPVDKYTGAVYQPLSYIIDLYGWENYKSSPFSNSIRGLLQRLGTEAGREILGENIWVSATINNVKYDIAVADCRFPNEAQAIKDRGGVIWRLTRPGIGPVNDHISETSLDDWPWDAEITNSGSLYELREAVREAYKWTVKS